MFENVNVNEVRHFNSFPCDLPSHSHINILYMNARSMRNSIDDIRNHVLTSNFVIHILVIVETWLKKEDLPYFEIDKYSAVHSLRQGGRSGGGVTIYVHEDFDTQTKVMSLDKDDDNFLVVSLQKHKMYIAAIYRQPNNKNDPQCNFFFHNLNNLLESYRNMYILGDFNINLLINNDLTSKYKAYLESNGFNLLNKQSYSYPTRVSSHSSTCIDHVISDSIYSPDLQHDLYLFDLIADHKSILVNVKKSGIANSILRNASNAYEIVNHKRITEKNLLNNIQPINFDDYIDSIKSIFNANRITVNCRSKARKPYINDQILSLIQIRNNYAKLKSKFNSIYFVNEFKRYRNLVSHEINIAKKKFFSDYISNNIGNQKKIWQTLNQIIFNKRKKGTNYIDNVFHNGSYINDNHIKAEIFNDTYLNISQRIANEIQYNWDELNNYHKHEKYEILIPFFCTQVTEDEISLIIDNLKNSKACDVYGLSNFCVKLHKKALVKNLTILMNKQLFKGEYPKCLKIGVVSPIYKSSSKSNVLNYRPITVSPIFSKIFENVMLRRMENHLCNNKILHCNQFGFRYKSNTEIAIAHILNDVYSNLDKGKATSLVCIDLSKAFDCLNHDILIDKLSKLDFGKTFFNLLKSYLTDRLQAVKVNDTLSSFKLVSCGAPQGGVISGFLFNIYVNSIFNLDLYGNLYLYCDDCSLVSNECNTDLLKFSIEHDLLLLNRWFRYHFLIPNASKTKYILFHNKLRHEPFTERALNIHLDNKIIERVDNLKILGLIVDEALRFDKHIEHIRSLISPFIYAIRRVRYVIDQKTAMQLYYAYVHSRMVYMINFWSAANKQLIESVDVLQRNFLRIVFDKGRFCSREELYSEQLIPMSLTCKLAQAVMVFKIKHNMIVNNVIINPASLYHEHNTRARDNYVTDICRTEKAKQNFYMRAFCLFNSIPQQIKQFNSLKLFKKRYKEYLYDEWFGTLQRR